MSAADESLSLSVVLASPDGEPHALEQSLTALGAACEGLRFELIVVTASQPVRLTAVLPHGTAVRALALPRGTLTPLLWSHGYRAARGEIVAFTTAQCTVQRGWARALVQCIAAGFVGVGGGLELAAGASCTDRALFHLRYSAFPGGGGGGSGVRCQETHEIPGDNAAYRRDALLRHDKSLDRGFWEVDFHRRIRAEGARLARAYEMTVQFALAPSLASLAVQRFQHGRHSGAWHVFSGVRKRWQIIAAAPLVPGVLLLRIVRRAAGPRAGGSSALRPLFGSLLPLLILSSAWAAGEAVGALVGWPGVGRGNVA